MIEIKIDDKEVQNLLQTLQGRLKDMSPVMRKIAGIMHDAVEENFEQEGRPKWKPLSPRTIIQRQKKDWPGKKERRPHLEGIATLAFGQSSRAADQQSSSLL